MDAGPSEYMKDQLAKIHTNEKDLIYADMPCRMGGSTWNIWIS
jgi:hypothetical protein